VQSRLSSLPNLRSAHLAIPTFAQVGMRHFHFSRNKYHCPIVNLDKIWSLVGEEVRVCLIWVWVWD